MRHNFLPDDWDELSPLLDAVLERPPAARRAFLLETSGDDVQLRRRLEDLLVACERNDSLFDGSAAERFTRLLRERAPDLPPLIAGRYRVEREIGAGGMATVYLARDLRHDRNVALKVLNPELGAVIGSERFLTEIQVTATLQHPNLLPLFDSGETNGVLFFVMPFVDGETLRQRLARERQLPVDEAVRVACAIAGALDYAHRHGVVHRDLKPENILLHEGQPLVMDFGIALAVSNAGGTRITRSGISVGTPQYMSPEQATGDRQVDARSDTYSLGAVVYEMLSGDPPHTGSTVQAVVARLLTDAPRPLRTARPAVPDHVEAAVQVALAKLPADRFETAKEFADALSGATPRHVKQAAGLEVEGSRTPNSRRTRLALGRKLAPWALSATAIALAVQAGSRNTARTTPLQFEIVLPESVVVHSDWGPKVALSRDGTQLVIVASKRGATPSLYLRRLDDPVAHQVAGVEANGATFSPDGQWLAFSQGGSAYKVSVKGGRPVPLGFSGAVGSWGEDGRIVLATERGLSLTTVDQANPRPILQTDSTQGIVRYAFPQILPGGKNAVVTFYRGLDVVDSARLGIVSLDDGVMTDLNTLGAGGRYTAPDYLIFARPQGQVFAARFSLRKLALTGPPVKILDGIRMGIGGEADITVGNNQTLAYQEAEKLHQLVVVDRAGTERAVPAKADFFREPRVSPSGKHIAVHIGPVDIVGDISVVDAHAGVATRITTGGNNYRSEWTPDGRRILFLRRSGFDSEFVITKPWDRDGDSTVLARGRMNDFHELTLGPRGSVAIRRGQRHKDILLASVDSLASAKPIVATAADEFTPRLSPDETLLAYASGPLSRSEIFIQSVLAGSRIQVSMDGGTEPAWSRDGKTLFYRTSNRMMAATIARKPTLSVARRDTLFVDKYWRYPLHTAYDVFPNGDFLMVRDVTPTSRVFVISNWPSLLLAPRR